MTIMLEAHGCACTQAQFCSVYSVMVHVSWTGSLHGIALKIPRVEVLM